MFLALKTLLTFMIFVICQVNSLLLWKALLSDGLGDGLCRQPGAEILALQLIMILILAVVC